MNLSPYEVIALMAFESRIKEAFPGGVYIQHKPMGRLNPEPWSVEFRHGGKEFPAVVVRGVTLADAVGKALASPRPEPRP